MAVVFSEDTSKILDGPGILCQFGELH